MCFMCPTRQKSTNSAQKSVASPVSCVRSHDTGAPVDGPACRGPSSSNVVVQWCEMTEDDVCPPVDIVSTRASRRERKTPWPGLQYLPHDRRRGRGVECKPEAAGASRRRRRGRGRGPGTEFRGPRVPAFVAGERAVVPLQSTAYLAAPNHSAWWAGIVVWRRAAGSLQADASVSCVHDRRTGWRCDHRRGATSRVLGATDVTLVERVARRIASLVFRERAPEFPGAPGRAAVDRLTR